MATTLRKCNNSGRHSSLRRLSSIYFSAHLSWRGDRADGSAGLKGKKRLFFFLRKTQLKVSSRFKDKQFQDWRLTLTIQGKAVTDGVGVTTTWHRHRQARARGAGGTTQKRTIGGRTDNETQVKLMGQKKVENKGRKQNYRKHKGRMRLLK